MSAAEKSSLRLTLNWKAEPQFGGFYAAEQNGRFSEQKVSVQIQEGGSGTPTIQMITSGKTEYAIVSADEIALSHDRGATDVVAIFAAYQTNPQAIMTRAESNVKNLKEVFKKNGTLLWQSGLPYAQYLSKIYAPLKVKTAPYSGGIGNFLNDPKISQQCFFTSEPLLAEKQGVKVKTFLVADSGFNPYTTVLVTSASRLKKNPEEVKAVVKAVREGWKDYLKDPKPTNLFMQKINPAMDGETFAKSAAIQSPLIETPETKITGLGTMTKERWQKLIDQLMDLKLIKNSLAVENLFLNI